MIPDKKYTCYYCLKQYISSGSLRKHLCQDIICHPKHSARKKDYPGAKGCLEDHEARNNLSIKCPICNQGLPTDKALKAHKHYMHGPGQQNQKDRIANK